MTESRVFLYAFAVFGFILLNVYSDADLLAQSRLPGDFAPGDAVRLVVWQAPGMKGSLENLSLNDDYIIDRKGRIFLPLAGYVRVVGLTREVLADTLGRRYRKYATGIRFVCKPLVRLTVLGAVNRPGSYLVEPSASLWSVIDEAGGPTTVANFKKMYFARGGQVVADNLLAQFEKAYSIQEIGMRSGDQLILPAVSSFKFRTVLEYVSFASSLIILYFNIDRRNN